MTLLLINYCMVLRKLKPCKTCGDPSYIWSHGNCKNCDGMLRAKAEYQKPIVAPAKPFRIKPVSKKRTEALKRYRRLRDKYFEEHPICEFPGCQSTKITLHHKRGRIGAFLTDKRHFCSLCLHHHRFCEENPLESYKLGLSNNRLEK